MGIISVLVVIAVLILAYVSIYNGLVTKKISCDTAWAQISVQLKRRLDLIPNLVETVKGYAKHEQETLERVINARNAALSAKGPQEQIAAENALTGALRQVFALAESYPDLKANQNFLQLQSELTSTEGQIAHSRDGYNGAVQTYNTAIQQVPANFVAGISGFTQRTFFELSDGEKTAAERAPQVSFS